MICFGIDPSVTSSGFVVLQAETRCMKPELLHMSHSRFPKLKGHARYSAIASDMIDLLNKYRPQKVIIEGYGLSFKHKSSVVPLVELGGLLRYFLTQYEYRFFDPRPNQHKEFVTGKGNTPKAEVRKHTEKRWGIETQSDDQADAYGLAVMGLAQGQMISGLTPREMEIIGELKMT